MDASPPVPAKRAPVLAISSNKGGVGKTTLTSNLAIYFKALREDLPVLIVGLDDQTTLDRMFALRESRPGQGHLKHGWAERTLEGVIQLGEYGVHFVPSPPDVSLLKARAGDPRLLRRILDRTGWEGIVLLDTKSDLENLTQNALHAADRVLVPVADWASLVEAEKIFAMIQRGGQDARKARVVLTLVDRRTRIGGDTGSNLVDRLHGAIRQRGWSCYATALSRSPKVEALNSGTGRPLSILHHARGAAAHGELRDLASEVLMDVGFSIRPPEVRRRPPAAAPRRTAAGGVERFGQALLEAWRRG